MPITIADRKHRMPYGAQKDVAQGQGVSESYVSLAMNGEIHPKTPASRDKLRIVQEALALKLGVPVAEAFPEADQEVAPVLAHTS